MDPDSIVDRYADMVYRLAFAQVKNRTDADDVFQEVFIRLVKYLDTIENEEHLKAWLIRVTINCARKHFGSYWNKNVSGMDEVQEEQYAADTQVQTQTPVTDEVIKTEEAETVTAAILKSSESAVKTQLFRGRSLLKEKLKGDWQ